MPSSPKNPYAIYVHCDGSMVYDSKSSGGIGYYIMFPEHLGLESLSESVGRFVGANIERLELQGIIAGINGLIDYYENHADQLSEVDTIILVTDRFALQDSDRTNAYKIQQWRKDKWKNHEGKEIKNYDLLDDLDKARTKLARIARSRVHIQYMPRKKNKVADKLSKAGRNQALADTSIAKKGEKIGKRKFDGAEITYNSLQSKETVDIRIFRKDPLKTQWEVWGEILDGEFKGRKLKIYCDDALASKLSRHHSYQVKIKTVFNHHIIIYKTMQELLKQK